MRERKYKAWVKDRCEFFPVFEIDFYDKSVGVWGCGNENCGTCSDYFYFDEIELIEYTGLKDKNGVEIYDGDIIKFSERTVNGGVFTHTCQVYQNERGTWWAEGYPDFDSDYKTRRHVYSVQRFCEVIGNVYENPELLKED